MPKNLCLAPAYDTPKWRHWIEALPERCDVATPDQRLYSGRNEVLLLEHENRRLAVKRFRNRGPWKKVAYRFSSSKARRSFEHSQHILEVGLPSPDPVAWLEVWNGSWLHQSFYVCEYVDYGHDASALADRSLADRIEKAELIGDAFARLHRNGIAHLDLNAGNLLFSQPAPGELSLYIIDNNRVRLRPVSLNQGCSLLLRSHLTDDILEAALKTYAQERNYPYDRLRASYDSQRSRYLLNRRIRDATRPWRRRLGL